MSHRWVAARCDPSHVIVPLLDSDQLARKASFWLFLTLMADQSETTGVGDRLIRLMRQQGTWYVNVSKKTDHDNGRGENE